MSDTDESSLPSAEECEKRCQEFASITGTDTALAMFYLQDRNWSLDRSLNSYFEEMAATGDGSVSQLPSETGTETLASGTSTNPDKPSTETDSTDGARQLLDRNPFRIRLMSWNIDGLDQNSLRARTIGVCKTIEREAPHVVFLQEVVPQTEEILQELCPLYHLIPGNEESYYVAIMVKIGEVQVEETKILPFPNSVMCRNLLCLKCTVKGEKFFMMTSHLESTKNYGEARKEQLKQCFTYIQKREEDRTVVFGGDLNLRDKELEEMGGIPEKLYDIWELTGRRKEAQYTWDTQRNDNLEMPSRFKPRCRFDRLYIKFSEPKKVKPEYFELCGLERLKPSRRFCSDHWGLLVHFNILSKVPK